MVAAPAAVRTVVPATKHLPLANPPAAPEVAPVIVPVINPVTAPSSAACPAPFQLPVVTRWVIAPDTATDMALWCLERQLLAAHLLLRSGLPQPGFPMPHRRSPLWQLPKPQSPPHQWLPSLSWAATRYRQDRFGSWGCLLCIRNRDSSRITCLLRFPEQYAKIICKKRYLKTSIIPPPFPRYTDLGEMVTPATNSKFF